MRKKISEGYGVTKEKYEYDDLARIAESQGISLREACVELGFLSPERFEELVRPENMV